MLEEREGMGGGRTFLAGRERGLGELGRMPPQKGLLPKAMQPRLGPHGLLGSAPESIGRLQPPQSSALVHMLTPASRISPKWHQNGTFTDAGTWHGSKAGMEAALGVAICRPGPGVENQSGLHLMLLYL